MMARTAEYRDDIAGAITTGGSSTAYTVTSYQVFDTLAHMSGQMIAFVPHATNTNAVGVDMTLNVDGLGAKSIRMQPSIPIPSGTLVLGTPYVVVYNNSDAVFYLRNMTNPYNIPLGGSMTYWGATAPNSCFALPFGQAVSRTTYASLFTLVSTTFGTGDGSTTFNLPDLRGRVVACVDNMGGVTANRLTSGSLAALRHSIGGAGGADTVTLDRTMIPTGITSTGSNSISVSTSSALLAKGAFLVSDVGTGGSASRFGAGAVGDVTATGTNTINVTSNNTSGAAHDNLQPMILANCIMRVI
jgi:microcystin-dependent protein